MVCGWKRVLASLLFGTGNEYDTIERVSYLGCDSRDMMRYYVYICLYR
jgi:hypothetical protein